jgi:hypothetical protein
VIVQIYGIRHAHGGTLVAPLRGMVHAGHLFAKEPTGEQLAAAAQELDAFFGAGWSRVESIALDICAVARLAEHFDAAPVVEVATTGAAGELPPVQVRGVVEFTEPTQ